MAVQFDNLLVAYDGSEQAKLAVAYAKQLAATQNAQITILQVLPPVKYYLYFPDTYLYPELMNKQEALLEFITDQMSLELLPQNEQNMTIHVLEGSPKQTIVDYAEEHAMDMIIMGATGVHGINKLVMGSTASYVVSHAPCTVLIAKE